MNTNEVTQFLVYGHSFFLDEDIFSSSKKLPTILTSDVYKLLDINHLVKQVPTDLSLTNQEWPESVSPLLLKIHIEETLVVLKYTIEKYCKTQNSPPLDEHFWADSQEEAREEASLVDIRVQWQITSGPYFAYYTFHKC